MIVVFGSINADLVATVEVLPREGETRIASGYAVHAGGKGANQAVAAARQHHHFVRLQAMLRHGRCQPARGLAAFQ